MRSAAARALALAGLLALAGGCAHAPPRPPAELGQGAAFDQLRARRLETFEGSGRLAIRSPRGYSQVGFRMAYDAAAGFRVDFSWRALAGLISREGTILVRGDSVWVSAPLDSGEAGGTAADDLPLFGFTPGELASLLVEGPGAAVDEEELLSYRRIPGGAGYRIVLTGAGRRRTVDLDGATGDPLSQEVLDPISGRRLSVTYAKYRGRGPSRRATEVEFRDSDGPVRGKFLFSDQRVGIPLDSERFLPARSARLVRPGSEVGLGVLPRGTLSPFRGGFEV